MYANLLKLQIALWVYKVYYLDCNIISHLIDDCLEKHKAGWIMMISHVEANALKTLLHSTVQQRRSTDPWQWRKMPFTDR